jgi:signal transduction histidine kinase
LQTGKSILDYIDSSLIEDFKIQCETALNGESVQYEHFIEGGWFDFVITAMYDGNKEVIGLSIVGHNINDQKKNARIIRQQSEYLSNIAWFQSHQLRHPVSSILALLNLIKEEHDYHVTKEYLQALEIVTRQLDSIISAIVKQSRGM